MLKFLKAIGPAYKFLNSEWFEPAYAIITEVMDLLDGDATQADVEDVVAAVHVILPTHITEKYPLHKINPAIRAGYNFVVSIINMMYPATVK